MKNKACETHFADSNTLKKKTDVDGMVMRLYACDRCGKEYRTVERTLADMRTLEAETAGLIQVLTAERDRDRLLMETLANKLHELAEKEEVNTIDA